MMERWELPRGWGWRTLRNLVKVKYGKSLSERQRLGGDVPVYGANGVVGFHNASITKGQTIVIGRKGSAGAVNWSEIACWPIDTTFFIDEFPEILYPQFLYQFLRSQQIDRLQQSAAIPGLNRDVLYSVEVPIPYPDDPARSLAEQRRIVTRLELLLGETRAMREDIQTMRRDLAQVMESVLAEVFPNPNEDMPEGWGWKQIGEVAQDTERRNPSMRPNESFFYIDIAAIDNKNYCIRLEGVKEIQGKDAPSRARKEVHTNDIIFATTRPYLKNIAIVPQALDNQICSTGFCVLRAKPGLAIPKYLFFAVLTNSFIHQLTPKGANYPAVNDSDIYQAIIPIPSPNDSARSLAEQRRIVAYLEHIAEEIRAMDDVLAQDLRSLEALEQSILAAAFRGEV